MEIFGMPVVGVVTVNDILSLGALAIVLFLYVAGLLVGCVLWVVRLYIKWRKRGAVDGLR